MSPSKRKGKKKSRAPALSSEHREFGEEGNIYHFGCEGKKGKAIPLPGGRILFAEFSERG